MSNILSVRRVKVQTIDENGIPQGEATFGIVACDSHDLIFCDTYSSLEDLNEKINESKSIIDAVDFDNRFPSADHKKIGYGNFCGTDWYVLSTGLMILLNL